LTQINERSLGVERSGWGLNDDSYWPEISHLWTTLYGDGLMRNIALMQPDEYAPISVSLYSHDNHNIVLEVQETAAIQETANATYVGYELDWVDNPDVIPMDVRMPDCDGLETTRRIKAWMPQATERIACA